MGTDRQEIHKASLTFSRAVWSARDTTGKAVLYAASHAYRRLNRFQAAHTAKPEKRTLARTPHSVCEFICVTALAAALARTAHLLVLVQEY